MSFRQFFSRNRFFKEFAFIFQLLKVGLFCVFITRSFLIKQNAKSPTFWKSCFYFSIVKSWAFFSVFKTRCFLNQAKCQKPNFLKVLLYFPIVKSWAFLCFQNVKFFNQAKCQKPNFLKVLLLFFNC